MINNNLATQRKGLKDIWNAYMVKGATFSPNDIPFCPTTATVLPQSIITYNEAITIYNREIARNKYFFCDNYVCFYTDDGKFDGEKGIWFNPKKPLKILKHFAGVITPDFSTNQDFPIPIKYFNTYRMRAFGYWLGQNEIAVINNVRWGTPETYWYCFDGIPQNSIVAVGTVGGNPRKLIDRERFNIGIMVMAEVLKPNTIVVYGSANYLCFNQLRDSGVDIVAFHGKTSLAFWKRRKHE